MLPSNKQSFKRRGTGMGCQRLVTRDQVHGESWGRGQWLAFAIGLMAALAFLWWLWTRLAI